jgi:hypothetical protein
VVRPQRKHPLLHQPIVASEWTTKKTAVPSIVACESVAMQRPSSVDFVGPQHARHTAPSLSLLVPSSPQQLSRFLLTGGELPEVASAPAVPARKPPVASSSGPGGTQLPSSWVLSHCRYSPNGPAAPFCLDLFYSLNPIDFFNPIPLLTPVLSRVK